jgi:hypothetical protein
MTNHSRDDRIQILLNKDELEVLDSWRFAKRMPSRAAAVRELLKRGLASQEMDAASGALLAPEFGVPEQDCSSDPSI